MFSASNVTAVASTLIAFASLLLAAVQYRANKRTGLSANEKLQGISERLRSAIAIAQANGEICDEIVQRSKNPSISVAELRSLGRSARVSQQQLVRLLTAQQSEASTGLPGPPRIHSRPSPR